jgi:hypothetical protein
MSAPMSRPFTDASQDRGDPTLTSAPGQSRAVPFLPGMSYGNARRRFPKSHIFEFKVGVGRSLAAMAAEVSGQLLSRCPCPRP